MFLAVMLRNWWIILLSVVVTAGSTAFFAARQMPVYQAGTVIELKPSNLIETPQVVISVMNSLDNRTTINTVARKAASGATEKRVAERLGISPSAISASNISAVVVPQSNLIEVRAQSTSPEFAAAVANATAQEMLNEATRGVIDIQIIDEAEPPSSPIGSGISYMVMMGVLSGLVLGIVFALLEYTVRQMRMPTQRETAAAAD